VIAKDGKTIARSASVGGDAPLYEVQFDTTPGESYSIR
jgi:hypothetical protein